MSAVESPSHYTQGRIEAIYVIEQVLGQEGFRAFCMGNYLKYSIRANYKNGEEDLAKAKQYLEWATNGLPEPVDGKIPRKVDANPTLESLVEIKLLGMNPNWKVRTVHTELRGNGYCAHAEIFNVHDYTLRVISVPFQEGELYDDIARRIVKAFRE